MKTKILLITLTLATVVSFFYFKKDYLEQQKQVREQVLLEQRVVFERKSQQLEAIFKQIYQGARTISLLPGIRSLTGSNLPKGFIEKTRYDRSRFSEETEMTVQQIYNNLSANISASEIYCILSGFKPEQGETPFFMFDKVNVEKTEGEAKEAEAPKTADTPEQLEDEEYEFYKQQLSLFAKTYPTLKAKSLDDIPFSGSPVVRTCDNAQYPSKATGDVRNTNGMMFSVPIFSKNHSFMGIISAIIRTNVFEAILLDVPFIPITEEEIKKAETDKWKLPSVPSNFVLSNHDLNISIYDRRAKSLPSDILAIAQTDEGDRVISSDLQVSMQNKWTLQYLVPLTQFADKLSNLKFLFYSKLAVIFTVLAFIFYSVIMSGRKREQIENITAHMQSLAEGKLTAHATFHGSQEIKKLATVYANIVKDHENKVHVANSIAEGDLTVEVPLASSEDELGLALQRMILGLNETLSRISVAAAEVASVAQTISAASQSLSTGAIRSAEALTEITAVTTQIASQTGMTAQNAGQANQITQTSNSSAELSDRQMKDLVKAMQSIQSSAQDISKIIEVIGEISFQTKMLSFNASIEAERAGEHGRGFAVVAEEVRQLAARTATSASETGTLIQSSLQNVQAGGQLVAETSKALTEIVSRIAEVSSLMAEIAAASKEQATGIAQVNKSLGEIDGVNQANSTTAKSATAAAEALTSNTVTLNEAISRFSLRA